MNFKKWIFIGISFLVSILLVEFAMRGLGYLEYNTSERQATIKKFYNKNNSKSFFVPDSLLGYKLQPGNYYVPLNDTSFFCTTHDEQGFRNSIDVDKDRRSQIHIYGCSVSYGVCVESDKIVSALLNNLLDTTKCINYAVPAYGTVQNYLELAKNIDAGHIPETVFFVYGSFHEERNAMSSTWMKNFAATDFTQNKFQIPYATLVDDTIVIKYKKLGYKGLLFIRQSVFMNFIDDLLNKRQTEANHELTIPLFNKIFLLTERNRINLVICYLTNDVETKKIISYCKERGIHTINFSEIAKKNDCSCMPKDSHPNFKAHKLFADSIYNYLRKSVN